MTYFLEIKYHLTALNSNANKIIYLYFLTKILIIGAQGRNVMNVELKAF